MHPPVTIWFRSATGGAAGCFDGDFYRVRDRPAEFPLTNLVFVQSRDGNTVADDPSTLGGAIPTDI